MKSNSLQDRIKNNIEYFRGIDVNGGLYIIKVQYKAKWGTYPSKDEKIKVAKSEDNDNEYFYYGKVEETSIDAIFDLIEETIQVNTEANMKVQLMMLKIEELKTIFAKESLATLETLYFGFNEPKTIKPKAKRKITKKKKETEVVNQEMPQEEEIKSEETVEVNVE